MSTVKATAEILCAWIESNPNLSPVDVAMAARGIVCALNTPLSDKDEKIKHLETLLEYTEQIAASRLQEINALERLLESRDAP